MAIEECIDRGILKAFLLEHREEVKKMSLIDVTFEKREQIFRQEEREDGLQEGLQQGIQSTITLLKTYLPNFDELDTNELLERIRSTPGYENITLETLQKYL